MKTVPPIAVADGTLRYTILIVLTLLALISPTLAQTSVTDTRTPAALTPGSPAGSYGLSGFDNINLYTGGLSFHLPLLKVGGRGGASFTITLPIEQKWRVDHNFQFDQHWPNHNWWTGLRPGYGAGVLQGRQTHEGCGDGGPVPDGEVQTSSMTTLTFTAPDGTEYELRDELTGGNRLVSTCCCYYGTSTGASRGTVFKTFDGTAATFISDSTINDWSGGIESGPHMIYPTGDFILRDGTRYRIVNGGVTSIRDRNGNRISFQGNTITDSLGRVITIDYGFNDPTYGLCDRITFSGFGGATRRIWVTYTTLGNVLRNTQTYDITSPQTYAQLFPLLDGSSSTQHNPSGTISSVWLPDGRRYQFFYNTYSELARVVLPTGGAIEYDWANGGGGVMCSTAPEIQRRVIERRVYRIGTTLEGKTTYEGNEVVSRDANGTPIARSKHYFHVPTNPCPSSLTYMQWNEGKEYQTEDYTPDGATLLKRVTQTWQQTAPSWHWPVWTFEASNNPKLVTTATALEPNGVNLVTKQTAINPQTGAIGFDQFNNQTDLWEYDFGTSAPSAQPVRHTHTDYLTVNPVNSVDYTTASVHIRSLPIARKIYSVNPSTGAETLVAQSETKYDETALFPWYGTVQSWVDPGAARGNPTKLRSWLNPGNTWLEARAQFDQVGNVTKSWDAKNNATEIAYSPACHFAYPIQTTSAIPDPSGQFGSTTAFVTTTAYDFSTGLVTSKTDANNQTTNVLYNDALERPTQVTRAVGTSVQNQTTFAYDDVIRTITTTSDLNAFNDNVLKTEVVYDGLGRTTETRQYEGGTNYIVTQQQYDALGRVFKTSNPFRPWQGQSAVWTTTTFDALSRVLTVTTPDNAVVTTAYSGNKVQVTDQGTAQSRSSRRSKTDALGRLTEVIEFTRTLQNPALVDDPLASDYITNYVYDVLDNLITVTQGTQQRFFMYDSLKRLIRARNPEQNINTSLDLSDPLTGNSQWCMAYQYDNNGNLLQKTDARGVTSTYVYDALNRNTTVDYSDTTPDSFRQYDQAIKGKGRLNQVWQSGTTTSATYIDSYDELGRPLIQRQRYETGGVWSSSYQVQRAYNLAGGVTTQTYPSNRTVNYGYDSAGRLESFTGYLGGLYRNYSTEVLYSPFGGISKEKFGTDTPLFNKAFHNSRGQLSEIRVGTTYTGPTDGGWERGAIINHYSNQCWGACNGTDNNGNLKKQDHWIPDSGGGVQAVFGQTFTYDNLNRLLRVQEGSWQQEYVYDRWGNRRIEQNNTWGAGINKKDFAVEASTNRLYAPGDLALPDSQRQMQYDTSGNLKKDIYTSAGDRVYDAENRMTKAWGGNNQWQEYTYNADGQRTRRKIDGVETWQIYGMDGELVVEYAAGAAVTSPQKEYGYRNGQLLVTATAPVASGTGLRGQYFDNMNLTDLKVTRTDATVDFDWGGGTPDPAIGVDTFTVRWQGKVEPQYSQTYTFYTHSDDGVRLWVNGQLLIDKWIDQGPTEWSGQIALTAGQRYDILMEFYENGGGAMAKLWWSSASQPKQIVPQSRLYPPGSSSQVTFEWLVADQLGTPRIILDKTGSLASTKRHDYLPFGEELFAGVGGRTIALGYTADNTRQQFTSKERDNETGLDFFGARYYASTQGRFTSPDPLMASAHVRNPQTWNRYAYALNNPLRYIDPDGMKPVFGEYKDLTEDERRILDNSKVTVGKGKNAQTLSGQALYDYMANPANKMQKQLAGFLNMTAGLADIKFSNGSRAIDYVQGITGGTRERIYANVDAGLKTQMDTISAKKHTEGIRFIGPGGQAVPHESGGIDYDVTFRENLPNGPMQLSFASKENYTRMDMDMDEHCQNCGDAAAEAAHILDGAMHRLTGGTNPEYIHKLLTERKINPSYSIQK